MGVVGYRGKVYNTYSFDKAEEEHERRSANGESVVITSAAAWGGTPGEYFVRETLRRPGSSDEPED